MAVQFNGKSFDLKYLFRSTLKDGSVYKQTKEDKSLFKENGSAFTDIAEEELKSFSLERWGEKYEVNLLNGTFTVNGKEIKLHDEPVKDFRLVYFRRHFHNSIQDKEVSHDVEYHFGWQSTFNGKNIKHIMVIK
jgi:hypothetical protein